MKIEKYLKASPYFVLNAVSERVNARLAEVFKSEGLSFMQGLVLTALFFEDGRSIKPSELAEILRTTRGNISHCISRLEEKGFTKRTVDTDDARAFQIGLRADGRRKALELIKLFNRLQDEAEKKVGEGACRMLIELLEHFESS